MATQTNPDGFTYDPVTGTPVDKPTADNAAARWRQIDAKATSAESGSTAALATLGAVKQEATDAKTAAQQSASSAIAAQNAATDAEGTAERFGDDVELLKQMAQIEPGSVTDAQTALLIQDPESETRSRLNAQSAKVVEPIAGVDIHSRGVVGDGLANDTAAFQALIDELGGKGGGRIVCHPDDVIAVQTLTARANVKIDLNGATLRASTSMTTNLVGSGAFRADGFSISNGSIDMAGKVHRAVYLTEARGAACAFLDIDGTAGTIVSKTGIIFGPNTDDCAAEHNTVSMPYEEAPISGTSYVGINCSSTVVDGQSGGQNATLTFQEPTQLSRGHLIRYNTLRGGSHGVSLVGATGVKVIYNETYDQSHRGIILSPRAVGNKITFNILREFVSTGIHLAWGSSGNEIIGNDLHTTRSGTEGDGIKGYFGCSDNTVQSNIINGAINGVRFAVGSMNNTVSGNRVIDCLNGVVIQSLLGGAYYQPASLPQTIGGTITGNDFSGANRSDDTAIVLETGGAYGVRRINITGNTGKGLTNGVKVIEAQNFTVDGLTATGNDFDATNKWVLPRGMSHFYTASGNRGLNAVATDAVTILRRSATATQPGLGSQDAATFTRVNGASKTEYCVQFAGFPPVVLATSP